MCHIKVKLNQCQRAWGLMPPFLPVATAVAETTGLLLQLMAHQNEPNLKSQLNRTFEHTQWC